MPEPWRQWDWPGGGNRSQQPLLGKRNVPPIRERADVIHVFVSAIVHGALDRIESHSARCVLAMINAGHSWTFGPNCD